MVVAAVVYDNDFPRANVSVAHLFADANFRDAQVNQDMNARGVLQSDLEDMG